MARSHAVWLRAFTRANEFVNTHLERNQVRAIHRHVLLISLRSADTNAIHVGLSVALEIVKDPCAEKKRSVLLRAETGRVSEDCPLCRHSIVAADRGVPVRNRLHLRANGVNDKAPRCFRHEASRTSIRRDGAIDNFKRKVGRIHRLVAQRSHRLGGVVVVDRVAVAIPQCDVQESSAHTRAQQTGGTSVDDPTIQTRVAISIERRRRHCSASAVYRNKTILRMDDDRGYDGDVEGLHRLEKGVRHGTCRLVVSI